MERKVVDVVELLSVSELTDIQFFELWAKRREQDSTQDTGAVSPSSSEGGDENIVEPIQVFLHGDSERLVVRAVMSLEGPDADYRVDAAAAYTYSEPCDVAEEIRLEFAERVGVMALYPFLREALYSTAARMRLEVPVLGLLRAGQIKLTADEPAGARR